MFLLQDLLAMQGLHTGDQLHCQAQPTAGGAGPSWGYLPPDRAGRTKSELGMNPHPVSHCRKGTEAPSPFLLLHPLPHIVCGAWNAAWGRFGVGYREHSHFPHRFQMHSESYSVSITTLPRVTHTGLTAETILSPSKTHTPLNSQIRIRPGGPGSGIL